MATSCTLAEPHDCAAVRGANRTLRLRMERTRDRADRITSMVRGLIAEIRKRDPKGATIPDHLYRALENEVQP